MVTEGARKRGSILARVRRAYERNPYPAVDVSVVKRPAWRLPPLEWIFAIGSPGGEMAPPRRILVAGCGSGNEAFAFRSRFPDAEIVGVDFSPRSIDIARRLQRSFGKRRRVEFVVGDLSSRRLSGIVGRDFDFVSCHGVLSYIPSSERVLANLFRCLSDEGLLYLGVNGIEHFSVRLRPVLQTLGFDLQEIDDGRRLRDILRFHDAVVGLTGARRPAQLSTAFLASDLFGDLIQTFSLEEWLRLASEAGLHFQGSYLSWRALRPAMQPQLARWLMPRSRAQLHELADLLAPNSFHPLVFTKHPQTDIPWMDHAELRGWRPRVTGIYSGRLPKPSRSWNSARPFTLKSAELDTRLEWNMADWELELLRQSDGRRSLGEILDSIPARVVFRELRQQVYVLYQLLMVSLLPPRPSTPRG